MRGYVLLGAITADQAAQQAMPTSSIRNTPGFTQAVYNDIVQAAQTGTFQAFNPSGCGGVSAGGNIRIAQTASGLALTGVSMGLTEAGAVAAATLAPFTLGISALIGLFPLFFSHHSAAVAKEQKTICAAVPAAANYLQQIQAAVQQGYATPAQAIAALQSLLSDFTSQMQSIMKNNASQCNAACVWVKELTAIVAFKVSQYQDLIAQTSAPIASSSGPTSAAPVSSGSTLQVPVAFGISPAPATSVTPAATVAASAAAASSPSWLPLAALVIGGFFLMKAL